MKYNKFGSTRTNYDGHSFHSKLEASVYQLIKLREDAGELRLLQCQAHVYLTDARIGYVPDFRCETREGLEVFIEAKGFETEKWPIIKKLWAFYGPAPLEIWKGSYLRTKLIEIISPDRSRRAVITP